MDEHRTVILVEDNKIPYSAIRADLEAHGWHVYRAKDRDSTWFIIEQCEKEQREIDAFAVDLGFPPATENPFIAGIPLIAEIREFGHALPILGYTGLPSTQFAYDQAARQLLRLRASFLYYRRLGDRINFSDILELTWQGYVIVSPEVADKLHSAISSKPDPLDNKQWELLHLLNERQTRGEIAHNMGNYSKGSVINWVSEIKIKLMDAGELKQYQDQDEDLINWYISNKVRYCRE